jgi:hypothetical protein
MTQRLIVASPAEPSGVTWLINCFLELGLLCYRGSIDGMWERRDGLLYLKAREAELRNWLPSLYHRQSFSFRPGIEVLWSHVWPTAALADRQAIYFYRDPRDSLYSRYKRQGATLSFGDFLDIPEPNILLNKIECNCLHAACWLQHPQVKLLRFEDYKLNAESTLRTALDYLGVQATGSEIADALAASTADKAKEAEQAIRADKASRVEPSGRGQIVNQGGIVGRWKELSDGHEDAVVRIQTVAQELLPDFGYEFGTPPGSAVSAASYMHYLSSLAHFQGELIQPTLGPGDREQVAALEQRIAEFARDLTSELAASAHMSTSDLRTLLVDLAIVASRLDSAALANIERVSAHFFGESELYYRLFQRTKRPAWLTKINMRYIFDKLLRPATSGAAGKRGGSE